MEFKMKSKQKTYVLKVVNWETSVWKACYYFLEYFQMRKESFFVN